MYVSPVGFGLAAVPDDYRWLFLLNPVAGLIEGFRWSLLAQANVLTPYAVLTTVAWVVVLVPTGLRYFRQTEKTFADVI